MRENYREPAKKICGALLDYAVRQDERFRESGEPDLIDDKTVLIVKRTQISRQAGTDSCSRVKSWGDALSVRSSSSCSHAKLSAPQICFIDSQ